MGRLFFLFCFLWTLSSISIAQEYYYEADLADSTISVIDDTSYESAHQSQQQDDEYFSQPGIFSRENSQEKELQKKAADITSGTLKTIMFVGLAAICIVGFILNNTR